jgi:hypothetical protein
MDNKDPDFLNQSFDKEDKKPEKKDQSQKSQDTDLPVETASPAETDIPLDTDIETEADMPPESEISLEPEDSALKIEQFEQEEADSQISEEIFDNVAISALDEEETQPEFELSEPHLVDDNASAFDEPAIKKVETEVEPYDLDSEYDMQPGINYKPIIFILAAIAIITLAYFGISNFFFSDEAASESETVAETPEQSQQREQQELRKQFLTTVSAKNKSRLGQVAALIKLRPGNITYSSILLYGESLILEVFARNRDDLAGFNLALKNNPTVTNYNIETVDIRPGQKGGLFALYDLTIRQSTPSSGQSVAEFTQYSPSEWANRIGLSIKSQRRISSGRENQFSVTRHEYIINGSEQKCHNAIQQMTTSNANYRIHKLTLLPTNQTSMNKSSYQMRVVLDFYI